MVGTYTAVTLGEALQDMGSRLADPQHVRWPEDELVRYIRQAIRTYNALTNHFRDTASFTTTVNQAFYDLPTILPTLRAMTYTVRDAVDEILWHLLEPPLNGTMWTGTLQYSLADVLSALQEARDTFLLETGIVQTNSQLVVNPFPATGTVDLPEEMINLRRLSWLTANGQMTLLRRDDQWGLTNYRPDWQTATANPPKAYSVSTQPPLVVQLAPISSVDGILDLITINSGVVPNILATQPLGVPDDWAWVVIFGALGQLFQRDGLALDVARASYCSQRWEHGLKMARQAAVVLSGRVEGFQTTLGSIYDADVYSPAWQMVSAVPKRILSAGHNLVALWPPPGVKLGGGQFEITLQVVRNAPVPILTSEYLQIGPELVNDLLDYAQHLALIKEGGGQIQQAGALLQQFMTLCGTTLDIQYASQPEEAAASKQTVQDSAVLAYRT